MLRERTGVTKKRDDIVNVRKIATWILCLALVLSLIPPQSAEAETKLSKCKISLANTTYTYTKKAIKPKVTVKYKSKKLKSNKNYTVTYKNNKKVGTATVVIKGKGGYKGTVKKKFKIVPKLSKTSVSLKVGKTYTLKATSSSKVTYKSSDTSVATVSAKGVVKAKKAGTAKITVTSNKVKNTCKVTVSDEINPASMTQYSLSETEKTIRVGDNTASISIVGYTGGNATATSSNEALIHAAYIDAGKIELYAHDAGTATVTVKVEGQTLTCKIVAVDENNASGGTGDNKDGNSAYGRLSAGEINLRWGDAWSFGRVGEFAQKTVASCESSNTNIATVIPFSSNITVGGFGGTEQNEFYVEAVGTGKATITVTATDGSKGCMDVNVSDCGITVSDMGSSTYSTTVDAVENGSFSYGQSASSVIGAKDLETTFGEQYNHPSGLAYYKDSGTGTVYFVVTDAWNNRVFLYKGTSISDATAKAPAVILGQPDINSCTPGYSLDNMNWPMDCAIDSSTGMLYVADTHNNRVLVYDDITTLTTGCGADHVIDWFTSDHSQHGNHLYWPWSVSTDCAGKLVVASTLGGNVLVWNEIPDAWEQSDVNFYPDIIMNMGNSSTPRTLTWTGQQLIIGDENVPGKGNGLYVYHTFPTDASLKSIADNSGGNISYTSENGQTIVKVENAGSAYIADTILVGGYGEGVMRDGQLYMAYASCIRTWKDGRIDSSSDTGDVYTNQMRDVEFKEDGGVFLNGGGIWKTIYAEGNLYLALHNGNKIIGWSGGKLDTSSVSAYQKTSNPDLVIGDKGGVIHNPIPVTDEKHLVVLDDLGQSIYVYKNIPTSSGAQPDYCYSTPYEIGDAALRTYVENGVEKEALILTSRTQNIIYIWKDYKFDGAMPDAVLGKRVGSRFFGREMEYVEFDGTYTYISTYVDGEYVTLIYRGLPEKESEPVGYIRGIDQAADVSSNGDYISVVAGKELWIYQTSMLSDARESSPVTLSRSDADVIDAVNIGTEPTPDNDGEEYGSCSDQHFHIYEAVINGMTYKRHERTTLDGVVSTLIAEDGKYFVADMADDRVLIWNSVADAINGITPIVIGHGEHMYDLDDMIGTYGYHDVQEAVFADTLSMPRYLAYDGKNLWVGEFKFSNRLLRYARK